MTMAKHADGDKQDATEAPRAARIVIVLGRSKKLDLKPLVDRAWRERVPLVIINMGFPLTPSQQKIVDAALEAAGTGAIALDAMIAYDARQAVSLIGPTDEVIFAASRGERQLVARASQPT
jgi:hypothetical protein